MQVRDDRTEEQKKTHKFLVIGTDSFMSGWGAAEGGVSYAAWACTDGDVYAVERWVNKRSEMKRVRVFVECCGSKWRPRGKGDAHIYVVDGEHPAKRG